MEQYIEKHIDCICNRYGNKIDKINDNIYLGNWNGLCDLDLLQTLGINRIVSVVEYKPPNISTILPGIQHYHLHITDEGFLLDDNKTFREALLELYEFMDKGYNNNEKIFIHCMCGMNR